MGIKRLKFEENALGTVDTGAIWQTILQDFTGKAALDQKDDRDSEIRGLFWSHASLSLTTLYFPLRQLALSTAGTSASGIVMLRAMEGRLSVRQRHLRIEAAKGDVILLPAEHPMSVVLQDGGRLDCAYLPAYALGAKRRMLAGAMMKPIPGSTLALQLLISYAGYLLQQDYQAGNDADMLVKHFYDLLPLLADAFGKNVAHNPSGTRAAAIKSHIEGSLGDSRLSIGDVANWEGISERAIQKIFKAEQTTFSRYVLERRLEIAKAALVLKGGAAPITQIAMDVGIDDTSYFSRAFKARYGLPPSRLRSSVSKS